MEKNVCLLFVGDLFAAFVKINWYGIELACHWRGAGKSRAIFEIYFYT
jgi:hypothetical protein